MVLGSIPSGVRSARRSTIPELALTSVQSNVAVANAYRYIFFFWFCRSLPVKRALNFCAIFPLYLLAIFRRPTDAIRQDAEIFKDMACKVEYSMLVLFFPFQIAVFKATIAVIMNLFMIDGGAQE